MIVFGCLWFVQLWFDIYCDFSILFFRSSCAKLSEFKGFRSHHEKPLSWFVHFICCSFPLKMNFIVPVALNPDFLLKTLNVHATIFFSQKFFVFSVGNFLGFWRANHRFKSLKKENILWGSWALNMQRGLFFALSKQLFADTFWLNMLIFLGLTIMNIGLATSVGISCLWFNIRWEGIPQVNQKVRVWDSKTTMAGLLQFSLFHILKLKSSPVVFYALIFLFISTSTDSWNMLFCCRHFTCLGL
jgi:hypothetical protein